VKPFEHNGKKFTNADAWRTAKATSKPQAAPSPEGELGGEPEDGAEIAQQHGPAHEVHLQHNHEGGQHHVHSLHPDGHEHHSDHASAEEAHEHAKKLASSGGNEEPQEEAGEPWEGAE